MVSMLVWLYGSNFRKNRISEQMNERWQNSSHQSEFAQNDFIELSSLRSICISICVTNNNYIASAFTCRNIDWCFLLSYELKSMNVIDMDLDGNMAVTVIDAMRCDVKRLHFKIEKFALSISWSTHARMREVNGIVAFENWGSNCCCCCCQHIVLICLLFDTFKLETLTN